MNRSIQQRQLLDFLRRKELLLVMDNFEHLVAGAGLVVDILETAPRVKVLATSRLRLGVPGEQLYPIGGLAIPGGAEVVEPEAGDSLDRYASIKLFAQTAQRLRPSFSLSGRQCRRRDPRLWACGGHAVGYRAGGKLDRNARTLRDRN